MTVHHDRRVAAPWAFRSPTAPIPLPPLMRLVALGPRSGRRPPPYPCPRVGWLILTVFLAALAALAYLLLSGASRTSASTS